MLKLFYTIGCLVCLTIAQNCGQKKATVNESTKDVSVITPKKENMETKPNADTVKVVKTDAEWKQLLDPEVFAVARQKGTERPWSSPFENSKKIGTYYCKACGNALFKSDTKFDSGCGWPSFYEPISKNSMLYNVDKTHGMVRTEVVCGKCESHLGHVFEDGPPPTGLRYCINGVILKFEEKKEVEAKKE